MTKEPPECTENGCEELAAYEYTPEYGVAALAYYCADHANYYWEKARTMRDSLQAVGPGDRDLAEQLDEDHPFEHQIQDE